MDWNVVVTGGGTVAPVDDVRSLTNVSSGRFSALITEACLARGALVHHVHAPSAVLPFQRDSRFDLTCEDPAREFARLDRLRREYRRHRDRLILREVPGGRVAAYAAMLERLLSERPVDLIFLAMAVSDYLPEPVAGKIKSSRDELVIRCKPARKVIRSARDWAPGAYLIGFKLLSGRSEEDLIREASLACASNRADLTVANDLSTLREGRHVVHLVRPGEAVETLAPGETMADALVERVMQWASSSRMVSPEGSG